MKIVMNKVILSSVIACSLILTASADDSDVAVNSFKLIEKGTKGDGQIDFETGTVKGDVMKLSLNRKISPCYMTVRAKFKQHVSGQKKLVFWLKGNTGNSKAYLTVAFSVVKDKEWKMPMGPRLDISDDEWHQVVLGLDSDFKLSDAVYSMRQIKFILNASQMVKGGDASVQVSKVQILDSDEVRGLNVGEN